VLITFRFLALGADYAASGVFLITASYANELHFLACKINQVLTMRVHFANEKEFSHSFKQ